MPLDSLCILSLVFPRAALCLSLKSLCLSLVLSTHPVYLCVFIPLCLFQSPSPFMFVSGPLLQAWVWGRLSSPSQHFQPELPVLLDKEPRFEAKLGWGFQEPQSVSISSFTYLTSTFVALDPY